MYSTTDSELSTELKHKMTSSHCPPADSMMADATTCGNVRSRRDTIGVKSSGEDLDFEKSVVVVAENSIEAQRIENNYKFGMKKWKSHVTLRPIDTRSEIIQDLYSDISKFKDVRVSTIRPSNIIYILLFGWWMCLVYGIVGILMLLSVIGIPYAKFCWKLAGYFFWPFGKFVHQVRSSKMIYSNQKSYQSDTTSASNGGITPHPDVDKSGEAASLLNSTSDTSSVYEDRGNRCLDLLRRPSFWAWLILGLPVLVVVHSVVFFVCWFFVISIPTAKLNGKTLTKILFLPPNEMKIGDSGLNYVDGKRSRYSEIIMYSHQSINFYYYKYTIDGVNVILANLLIFVVLSIVIGYTLDIDGVVKCILGSLAIIPLTYYIGMAITSISAQSSFAVGAFLNATFGSAVEVILFIIMLNKGRDTGQECYQELVKSSLTGAILCSILFIPGMSMVIGGLKFRTQRFNPRSANISATLLFLSVLGVFAPTIFSKIYGSLKCRGCEEVNSPIHEGRFKNNTMGFLCQECEQSLKGVNGDQSVYQEHIRPLVYGVCIVLPIAYVIGVVFTMKTHSAHVFADFEKELKEENASNMTGHHGTAQWSRLKSCIILLMCAVCIALCSDLISENIQPLLETSGISEYFIGVTMLSLVAELPEVVNGVQFALQNNVNLGIEIGCSTAIQVCLVQIPVLVLTNLIYEMNFYLVFNDIHLWAVIFSVIIINYIFQDGKSDYFQGSIVIGIYLLLMLMYFFMLTPDHAVCKSSDSGLSTTTTTPTTPQSRL